MNSVLPAVQAGSETPAPAEDGATQISVLEGSRVELEVVCKNKALKQVELVLRGRRFRLTPVDGRRRDWRLHVAGTPLECVTESLPFSISAIDLDGLQPADPLSGQIAPAIDRGPRVAASAVTQTVVPTARPTIHYHAGDDHALGGLAMRRELLRPGEAVRDELVQIPLGTSPVKTAKGTLTLDLADLRLLPGDLLRLTFEAVDARGPRKGKTTASEPLLLRVTDARGVLAATTETGDGTDEGLDGIIERQLLEETP